MQIVISQEPCQLGSTDRRPEGSRNFDVNVPPCLHVLWAASHLWLHFLQSSSSLSTSLPLFCQVIPGPWALIPLSFPIIPPACEVVVASCCCWFLGYITTHPLPGFLAPPYLLNSKIPELWILKMVSVWNQCFCFCMIKPILIQNPVLTVLSYKPKKFISHQEILLFF